MYINMPNETDTCTCLLTIEYIDMHTPHVCSYASFIRLWDCHTDDKDPTHQNQEFSFNSNQTVTSIMSGKCVSAVSGREVKTYKPTLTFFMHRKASCMHASLASMFLVHVHWNRFSDTRMTTRHPIYVSKY